MTDLAAAPAVGPLWPALLPAGRTFVALPSRGAPVVVAERERNVLEYVRTALLAAPPGSRLPAWAFPAAGQALRLPGIRYLLPRLGPAGVASADPGTDGLAAFVRAHGRRLLVLQHSRDPDARCVLLLFDEVSACPSFVVKLAAGAGAAQRMRREARRLEMLDDLPGRPLGAAVPRLVGLLDHRDGQALVTTAQPGVPMLVAYHRGRHTADRAGVARDFRLAGRWLARMQTVTAGEQQVLGLAPGVQAGIERLCAREGDRAGDLAGAVAALHDRLGRHRARSVLVHGDFWPGNLLTAGGKITGVVDWERSTEAGDPVRDYARFALCYSEYLDRHTSPGRRVHGHRGLVAGAPGGGVGYALDGAGWYPDLVRGFLRDGLARLGIPAACGRDAVLAEILAVAAEATEPGFAAGQLTLFRTVARSDR